MDASTRAGGSLAVTFSDDGQHAARTYNKDVIVYSKLTEELKDIQFVRFSKDAPQIVKFSSSQKGHSGQHAIGRRRLLVANGTTISVWNVDPLEKVGDIQNVESEYLHVDFGGDKSEVIMFHSWNTRMTVFCLNPSRTTVIKQPKLATHSGYAYRPRTRELAILLKPEVADVLTIHEPGSYKILNQTTLPTVDAQGLKWSPDGRWIAVWDLPSIGTKVLIYTADGQLFRTYSGPPDVDDPHDTGVKQIEWSSPGREGSSQILAVGRINGNIDLLNTRTFSSSTTLSHVFHIDLNSPNIWRERFTNALGDAEYVEATSSSAFNMCPETSGPPRGLSIMTFSSDGAFLATVDSARSNLVWVWSTASTPSLTCVLVHEQPVRQLAWHPRTSQLLISTVTNSLPVVRWWPSQGRPVIARVPTRPNESGKYDVKWMTSGETPDATTETGAVYDSAFWFGSSEEYVVGYLCEVEGAVQFEVLNSVGDNADYLRESQQ